MRRRQSLLSTGLLLLGLACCGSAVPGSAQNAAAKDTRLDRQLAVEVRVADVGELADQLSDSLHVPLSTDLEAGAQRVTLHAEKTSVASLQRGLAALFRASWQSTGEGEETRYKLVSSPLLPGEVARLRQQRRTAFLNRLLQTEYAFSRGNSQAATLAIRNDLARRMPYLPQATLEAITPDYLNQALLAAPLRLGLSNELARTGAVSVPLGRLSFVHQRLLASLFLERYESRLSQTRLAPDDEGAAGVLPNGVPDPRVLYLPQARLEYRLLFGDRWSGDLLLTRVGIADNWAVAALPSSLYALPDYTSLYQRPALSEKDTDLQRPVNVNVDTDALSWDQALLTVARAAKVNVLSDAYLRPEVFRSEEKGPIIVGTTLHETLDRIADYYGYVWWKQGDWFLFRNKLFGEYDRTVVPARVTRSISQALSKGDSLSTAALASLTGLSDEQLLTMHLYATAAGRPFASDRAFDLNGIDLARAGLVIYAQLNEAQREMARGTGIPFLLLNQQQQYLFLATAYDRGLTLNPYDQELWRFRVRERFDRERLPAGWAELGSVRVAFDYAGFVRSAELGIRVPALEPPADAKKPAEE
jgi:hypothetical protein